MNPRKRKGSLTVHLHSFREKFTSVAHLKSVIIFELEDELPDDSKMDVGYYESRQKVWIVSRRDLDVMYDKAKDGEIVFWIELCNEDTDSETEPVKKKKKNSKSTKQSKEDKLDDVFKELKEEHGSNYTIPQLKLWARMILCGTHDDYKDPPRVPMITGKQKTTSKASGL